MSQLLVAQRYGAGPYAGPVVSVVVVMALTVDHFGWIGSEGHGVNAWRMAGAVPIVVGVALIARF